MSWLAKIAPGYAASRARAQLDLERLEYTRGKLARESQRRRTSYAEKERIYDAASGGRRLAGWAAAADSGEVMESMLEVLRLRSRDLSRNNPYAAKAVGAIVSNAVGTGIQARLPGAPKTTQEAWRRWAESTDCDLAGRHDLYGIQALVMRGVVESGEVFVLKRVIDDPRAGRVPLQLQVLEAEYLAVNVTQGGSNRVSRGIEYDAAGRPVAYHFYTEHPGSSFFGSKVESRRWLAADVAHVFRVDRPGQTRGVPWGAPVMTRLNALDDYEDAQLERQRVAACFAAFIVDSTDEGQGPGAGGDTSRPMSERVEPGIIETLPSGKDVKFAAPPPVSDYSEYVATNLRAIASGYGVPYETLSGDLSKTSFASARIGWLEFDRCLKAWRRHVIHAQLLGPVWSWWAQVAGVMGLRINTLPEWTPPRREMLNPQEDVKTAVMRLRAGLASWSEVIRELGNDPDSVIQEIADDAARFDKHELILDIDPRRTTQSGQQQATGAPNEAPTATDEEEPAAAAE